MEENNMESLLASKIIAALWSILKRVYLLPKKISRWYKKDHPQKYECELSKEDWRELKGGIIKIIFNKNTYVITEATWQHFRQTREVTNISYDQGSNKSTDIVEGENISENEDKIKSQNKQEVLTKESMVDILKIFCVFNERKRILYFKKVLFDEINKKLKNRSLNMYIKYSDDRLKWISSFSDLDSSSFNSNEFDINISTKKC